MKETQFPEFTIVPDPLTEADHARAWRIDPRTAEEVIPTPVPPASASSLFVPPSQAEDRLAPPEEQPQAAQYHEHGFRWSAYDIEVANTGGNVAAFLEVSRWKVPDGCFGVISHIDTHFGLSVAVLEDDGRIVPNEISFDVPEQPFLLNSLYGLVYGNYMGGFSTAQSGVRWILRLESNGRTEEGAPRGVANSFALPGAPYLPLAEWRDMRFAWGRSREPLRLLVPEGHTARLFVGPDVRPGAAEQTLVMTVADVAGTSTFQNVIVLLGIPWSELALALVPAYLRVNMTNVAGRIVGTIQSYRDNPEARRLARRGLT